MQSEWRLLRLWVCEGLWWSGGPLPRLIVEPCPRLSLYLEKDFGLKRVGGFHSAFCFSCFVYNGLAFRCKGFGFLLDPGSLFDRYSLFAIVHRCQAGYR